MIDLDALERELLNTPRSIQFFDRGLGVIRELRASRKVVEAAREVDAAYPDEFGPEVWEGGADYRWKRAMHSQHAALADLEALAAPKQR